MNIKKAAQWINNSENIVFFGGAGTSTGSGIRDFRSEDGIYELMKNEKYTPEYLLSYDYYRNDPDGFAKFYKENMIFPDARPTKVHEVLFEWEKEGKLKMIITQNIDNLHQMAGSKCVNELHGNLFDHYCTSCGRNYTLEYAQKFEGKAICEDCGGTVRPDVTLYGESLPPGAFERAVDAISRADTFIVGGSSLVVYPAAGLLSYFRNNQLILINQQITPQDSLADLVLRDDIGKVLEEIQGAR